MAPYSAPAFRNFSPYSSHIIIKDDGGFHSGSSFPYYQGPLDSFKELISHYTAKNMPIVIEPLIFSTSNKINFSKIMKIHSFHGLVKGEILEYDVKWKKLEGKFGPDLIKIQKISTLSEMLKVAISSVII